ncbi:HAD family hydrolase [Candidatus Woesearchaeota archaeon]|nr:HAD family hydrolase [Candidatus Woesearchaeota archaeon]
MKNAQLAIFDLDQTLVELLPYHDRAISKAFSAFNVNAKFSDLDFAGKTAPMLVWELAAKKRIKLTKKLARLVVVNYAANFRGLLPKRIKPLKGVRKLLRQLTKQRTTLGVVTGGEHSTVEQVMRRAGLRKYFQYVECSTECPTKVGMLHSILRKERQRNPELSNEGIIVMGDSARDIEAGRHIGAHTIAVLTGPHTRKTLIKAKPDLIVKSLEELS